ncbi:MAG: hypothetical protein QM530_00055 [Phycisphaerales bacterium]|nr:hypothetical protein [Phycisphaerales bacterium]
MKITTLFTALIFWLSMSACKHSPTNYAGEYPDDVRNIMDNKCATAGCHNEKSYTNASGLRLDRWEQLWKGGNSGAVMIPYNAANSSLLYFINTDTNQGPVLLPSMPLNAAALSANEYATIKNWLAAGAPDKSGNVPFAAHPATRQKIYITQQGCDLIAVVDAASNLIMRYINIGKAPTIEVAHCVRFSPDGKYAYVSFSKGQYLQKIDAATDAVVDNLFLGVGSWNLFHLSSDGKKMLLTDLDNGILKLVDLEKWTVLQTFEDFVYPHGIEANAAFDTFWITAQDGNTVYKLSASGTVKLISIDDKEPHFLSQTYDPHEIIFSPDRTKYFLTCQASNEVRVMDARTDALLKVIPVGTYPQEFAMSKTKPYLFVSCEEEITAEFPNFKGAVYVIDYNSMTLVKRIPGPFYQIHGLAVDDAQQKLYVASRNALSSGPAPHHTSQCNGRNGYYNVYDINTLEPFTKKRFESTVDPYSADVRFK